MNILDDFVEDCKKIFKNNLSCILLLGSAQRDDTTPFSDLDVVILIKTMNLDDVVELRLKIRSSKVLLDCSILCEDEISEDPNKFCLGSHGCYQLELVLKRAKPIWGKNILMSLPTPNDVELRLSIAKKVIEYTWWTRRMFVESNRDRSLEDNYKLNSRLIKMIRDILYLNGNKKSITDSVSNSLNSFLYKFGYLLNKDEKKVILQLGNSIYINSNTSNMSDEYFFIRYSIVNKIHKEVVNLIKNE